METAAACEPNPSKPKAERDREARGAEGESMETGGACEIARLPEELLSAAISGTAPRDACRAAAVSPAFRAAADSDAVWSTFIPRDMPPLADGEISPAPPSKKGLFLRLSDHPVLLADRLMSLWLDRETGAKCYMLSARALNIAWGDTPRYWRWIALTDSRFSEGAELLRVWWLEIRGRIHSKMLTQNSNYAAYIVFKITNDSYGLDFLETSVGLGGSKSTRQVCLHGYDSSEDEDDDDEMEVPQRYFPLMPFIRPSLRTRSRRAIPRNVLLPQKRHDGWMELEMGEFCNEDGEDGEVCISLMETGGVLKKGLIVQGIEIRPSKK